MKTQFKKYLFSVLVATWVISSVGIPVYFHYCGGELEKINYVLKSDSCCDGEEEDEEANGCCKDEGLVLQSDIDGTFKEFHHSDVVKTFGQLFHISLPFSNFKSSENFSAKLHFKSSPPPIQHTEVISTTVLRI